MLLLFRSVIGRAIFHLRKSSSSMADTMADEGFVTVSYVTTPSEEVARDLARFAACVNIVNKVESIYEWNDKLHSDQEALMIIKSHSKRSEDLVNLVKQTVPYNCSEVITMKVESGNEVYLDWVKGSTMKKPMK